MDDRKYSGDYRMSIVYRSDLSKPMTWDQLDDNFRAVEVMTEEASRQASVSSEFALESRQSSISSLQSAENAEKWSIAAQSSAGAFESTSEGLSKTSSGQIFGVLSSDKNEILIIYKNVNGVAIDTGGRTPSAASIQDISDKLDEIITIGLSSTPLTGSYVAANTRVFNTAVEESGSARKIRTFSKNSGQVITLRRFSSSGGKALVVGDVLTQVGSDYLVPLADVDSAKEVDINFPVNAGEFIGVYGPSFIYPALTSGDGATMGQAATSGNYNSITVAGFGTGYRWQIGIDIVFNYVNADLVSGIDAAVQTLGSASSIGVSSIYDLPPSPKGRQGVVTGSPMGAVYSDGTIWRWTRDDTAVSVPWMRILDLAKRDGWKTVYDTSNEATLSIVESGGIEYLSAVSDSLGSSPAAIQSTPDKRPILYRDGIGGISSARFSGTQNLLISDSVIDDQPYCILGVTRFSGPTNLPTSTGKFAFSGRGANRPGIIGYDNSGTMTAWHGNGVAGNALSNSPTVFGAVFDGANTTAYENGWLTSVGLVTSTNKLQLGYIGADYQGLRGWLGDISAMLVYLGNPGQEKIERMQDLLADVFGIPVPGLEISALGATVTRLSDMKVLYEKAPSATGHVASVTKVMTALVLDRKVSDLSQTLTVVAGDIVDSATTMFVKAGDVVSYIDLMYASLLPSDNNAATAIARGVGYLINPGAANDKAAKAAFYAEMNAVAALLGMTSTIYNNSYEGCTSNATDLTKLLAHISANAPRMMAAGSQASHAITVTGTNPRTYTVISTIYPPFFPGYSFGKTGTGDSFGSLVFTWDKDGERYASVMVRSFPSTLRYREARWLMDEAINNPKP